MNQRARQTLAWITAAIAWFALAAADRALDAVGLTAWVEGLSGRAGGVLRYVWAWLGAPLTHGEAFLIGVPVAVWAAWAMQRRAGDTAAERTPAPGAVAAPESRPRLSDRQRYESLWGQLSELEQELLTKMYSSQDRFWIDESALRAFRSGKKLTVADWHTLVHALTREYDLADGGQGNGMGLSIKGQYVMATVHRNSQRGA